MMYFKVLAKNSEGTWTYVKVDPSQKTAEEWVSDLYIGQMNAAEVTEEEYLENTD